MNAPVVAVKRGTHSFFLSYILRRIERNKNFLAAITGQTGSGKSYSALRLGETLDPEFTIDRVVFDSKSFMRLINSDTLKPGSVIIYDEAGVGVSSQEWQSVQNRVINYLLQTFRHKNYIVFFTSPHLGFLAAPSRKLLHGYLETVGIDPKLKVCKLKPLLQQVSQRSGEPYFKYLRAVIPGRGIIPVKRISVGMPSDGLMRAYEEKKTAYTQALNADIERDLLSEGRKPLSSRQEEIVTLLRDGLVLPAVAERLGIGLPVVYDHLESIRRKGYIITPVKSGVTVIRYEVQT